ncbi:hypothetical protein C5167_001441 [Papaver somniferum]|uniref:AT3G52170-like helix-turn-helix domain-containing protein n=1 Tax=Papaver somniferum TaxID=3469 RepID=A0A4Y7KZ41_PAPSO|nr:uncharacterized protein LOC113307883 isoform X1 [Papaver somniferum]RZC77229.1 hypothetical protein C5167_001441 [Papaver somniferum]
MHAVKVPWVGQTFALANCSDSGGKKSRIRRSKEERKSMVESYIKKYQNSNGGSFPSLNLTHKEVGGSFYTVREIVREVIQENKVLGPAKFTLDEQNDDQMSEHYPLGSISTQPLNELYVSSSGTHFVANHNAVEELVDTVNGQVNGKHQQIFESGSSNKGNLVDKEYTETKSETSTAYLSYQMPCTDVEVISTSEGKLGEAQVIVQSPASRVTPMATGVIVETFPVIPAPKVNHGGDGSSADAKDLTIVLEEHDVKEVEISSATRKDDIVSEKMNSMVNEDESSSFAEVKSAGNDIHPVVERPSCSDAALSVETEEDEDIQIDASSNDVLTSQTSHHSQVISGNETEVVPGASYSMNNNANNSKSLSQVEDVDAKADMQGIQSNQGKKSTYDRINLSESWQATSKKHEMNPAMAAIKAFITAFINFWMD